MKITTVIRFTLTVVMLYFILAGAHWAVFAAVTALSAANEYAVVIMRQHQERINTLEWRLMQLEGRMRQIQ